MNTKRQDREDYRKGLSVLKRKEPTISLDQLERKLELEDSAIMPTLPQRFATSKSFTATLERSGEGLMWTIVRIPIDVEKTWGKRGQLRVKGEISSTIKSSPGFAFHTSLFPTGKGSHFMMVNKQMQAGAKVCAGMQARFRIEPDTAERKIDPSPELERVLKQSRALRKFHDELSYSNRREIARWIGLGKQAETRKRRAKQLAERMMETIEAERQLPPLIARALEANPKAREGWKKMTPRQRRMELMGIFYYRNPDSRARRLAKSLKMMLQVAGGERFHDTDGDSEKF